MKRFKARLKRVCKLVSPGDGGEVDNVGLLGAMMDVVESKSSTRDQRSSSSTGVAAGVAMQSFLHNSGIYTGDSNPEHKCVLEAQYTKLCKFALLGHVGHKYVKQDMRCCCCRCSAVRNIPSSVYERRGYVSLVAKAADNAICCGARGSQARVRQRWRGT